MEIHILLYYNILCNIKHIYSVMQFIDCIIEKAQKQSNGSLNSAQGGELLDMHWRPQHLLCNVCLIKFNIVGEWEASSHVD